jgi:glutaredoxin
LGVTLIEYDIEKDRTKAQEMFEKSGKRSVPFIDIEGMYVSGSSEKKIKHAVDQRRRI